MSVRPILAHRARIQRSLRGVFDAAGFLEVDTPVLATEVLPEAHIDPLPVTVAGEPASRYLQASPELLMKRLLAAGSGPIYQFARCFRAGESGSQHDLEFLLLEWYAPDTTLDDAAILLERLLTASLGTTGIDRVDCSGAFSLHAGVDPLRATADELESAGRAAGIRPPENSAVLEAAQRHDLWFELLLSDLVAPRLGVSRPAMLENWPVSQAAFARIEEADPPVARRFEIFFRGVELANGWEEEPSRPVLADRIRAANQIRVATGRGPLPEPERLLAAHGPAMPQGVGVALGFDRLAMLAAEESSIDAVRCFSSRTA
jgi:lysyl-tRNA synthetase class 2